MQKTIKLKEELRTEGVEPNCVAGPRILAAASQHAARDYAEAVNRIAGEVLQEAGLWDGRAETLKPAARNALRIEYHTYAEKPPVTLIFLHGMPVGKVTFSVSETDVTEAPETHASKSTS